MKNCKGVIYLITNLINGKKYIGQTTLTIEERFRTHCNRRNGMIISYSIQKYGKNNFKIEELYVSLNNADLNIAERALITAYNTLVPNGYNREPGGKGNKLENEYKAMTDRLKKWRKENKPVRIKPSPETLLKRSISLKKIPSAVRKSWYNKRREKLSFPVKIKHKNSQIELFFNSQYECAEYLKVRPTRLVEAIKRPAHKTIKGYFIAKKEENYKEFKPRTPKQLEHYKVPLKSICTVNGEVQYFNNILEASVLCSIDKHHILRVCKKTKGRKTLYGKIWEFI